MKAKGATIKELELHNSIVSGSDIALSRLYELYGEVIIKYLKRKFNKIARTDDSPILEAVNQTFLDYFQNPTGYNPAIIPLQKYLEMAAKMDLLNILEKDKRYSKKKELPADVELQEKFWNNTIETTETIDGEIIQTEIMNRIDQELAKHFNSDEDRLMAKLILAKERKTEVFAEILGIKNTDSDIQKTEVKKNKDRIKKVIERNELEKRIKALTNE